MPHDNIGALWIARDDKGNPRKDKNGNIFMSGSVDGKRVKVFKVSNKKDLKSPDFRIYPERPKEDRP